MQIPSLVKGAIKGSLKKIGYEINRADPEPSQPKPVHGNNGSKPAPKQPKRLPPTAEQLALRQIHYACGTKRLPGWLNVDFSPEPPGGDQPDSIYFGANLVRQHPFPDNHFEFGFSEDFLEHLTQSQALIFLSEAYRTFAPGGVLRLSFPGLSGVLEKHYRSADFEGAKAGQEEAYTAWGHKHFFCEESLRLAATHIGFREVRVVEFGVSEHAPLQGLDTREDQVDLNLLAELEK